MQPIYSAISAGRTFCATSVGINASTASVKIGFLIAWPHRMPGAVERGDMGDLRGAPCDFVPIFCDRAPESIRARAIKAGAVGLLTKPFDQKTLLDCVNSALHRS